MSLGLHVRHVQQNARITYQLSEFRSNVNLFNNFLFFQDDISSPYAAHNRGGKVAL